MFRQSLFAPANVGGCEIQILVDTGATVSLLQKRIWKQVVRKHETRDRQDVGTAVLYVNGQLLKMLGVAERTVNFG